MTAIVIVVILFLSLFSEHNANRKRLQPKQRSNDAVTGPSYLARNHHILQFDGRSVCADHNTGDLAGYTDHSFCLSTRNCLSKSHRKTRQQSLRQAVITDTPFMRGKSSEVHWKRFLCTEAGRGITL